MSGQIGLSTCVVSNPVRVPSRNKNSRKKDIPVSEDPPKLSQEQMAVALAQDISGSNPLTDSIRHKYQTELFGSVRNLVYQFAGRFAGSCAEDPDDLAQDCFLRLAANMWRWDSSKVEERKWKFTTWVWSVSTSVLIRKYRKAQRRRRTIIPANSLSPDDVDLNVFENLPDRPIEGIQHHECPGVMVGEIADAVRRLTFKYPNQRDLIFGMLGNPDSKSFIVPCRANVAEAAETMGIEYSRAYSFYLRVVRPFFRDRFSDKT